MAELPQAPRTSRQSAPRADGRTREEGKRSDLGSAALFRAHAGFVAAFIQRLGIAHEECADLVQEVFLLAHRKGGYRAGAARPTTWLAGLALGVTRNHRRRTGRRARLDQELLADEPEPTAADPERALAARRGLSLAREALDRISEEQRVVIMLHELQGESSVSIAAGLGVPVGTVYARLHRGRRAFRAAYSEAQQREGREDLT